VTRHDDEGRTKKRQKHGTVKKLDDDADADDDDDDDDMFRRERVSTFFTHSERARAREGKKKNEQPFPKRRLVLSNSPSSRLSHTLSHSSARRPRTPPPGRRGCPRRGSWRMQGSSRPESWQLSASPADSSTRPVGCSEARREQREANGPRQLTPRVLHGAPCYIVGGGA